MWAAKHDEWLDFLSDRLAPLGGSSAVMAAAAATANESEAWFDHARLQQKAIKLYNAAHGDASSALKTPSKGTKGGRTASSGGAKLKPFHQKQNVFIAQIEDWCVDFTYANPTLWLISTSGVWYRIAGALCPNGYHGSPHDDYRPVFSDVAEKYFVTSHIVMAVLDIFPLNYAAHYPVIVAEAAQRSGNKVNEITVLKHYAFIIEQLLSLERPVDWNPKISFKKSVFVSQLRKEGLAYHASGGINGLVRINNAHNARRVKHDGEEEGLNVFGTKRRRQLVALFESLDEEDRKKEEAFVPSFDEVDTSSSTSNTSNFNDEDNASAASDSDSSDDQDSDLEALDRIGRGNGEGDNAKRRRKGNKGKNGSRGRSQSDDFFDTSSSHHHHAKSQQHMTQKQLLQLIETELDNQHSEAFPGETALNVTKYAQKIKYPIEDSIFWRIENKRNVGIEPATLPLPTQSTQIHDNVSDISKLMIVYTTLVNMRDVLKIPYITLDTFQQIVTPPSDTNKPTHPLLKHIHIQLLSVILRNQIALNKKPQTVDAVASAADSVNLLLNTSLALPTECMTTTSVEECSEVMESFLTTGDAWLEVLRVLVLEQMGAQQQAELALVNNNTIVIDTAADTNNNIIDNNTSSSQDLSLLPTTITTSTRTSLPLNTSATSITTSYLPEYVDPIAELHSLLTTRILTDPEALSFSHPIDP
eukprot:gene32318-39905_t